MGFYGLSQNTSDLPGSPYVTFMLTALVELPGYVIAVPLMQYWGRKPTLVLLFAVGGISCILAGLLTHGKFNEIYRTLVIRYKLCRCDCGDYGDARQNVRSSRLCRRVQL